MSGAKHLVAFGELLLRCSPPGRELLLQSPRLDVWVGGAEANVVTQLARFGHRTAFVSAVPSTPLGDAALFALRGHGVNVDGVLRREGRMGLYFAAPGAGARATEVFYDRAHSAFATAADDAWDWTALLSGADRLHLSGITPALNACGSAAALTAVEAASRLGVPISLFFGNHRDISLLLGTTFEGDCPAGRRAAAQAAFARFPALETIASTVRHVEDAGSNRLAARIDTRDDAVETAEIAIAAIVDRIGGGDAFAAGVLHGLRTDMAISDIAEFALATSVLKHSLPGDASLFSVTDVQSAIGGELDVRR